MSEEEHPALSDEVALAIRAAQDPNVRQVMASISGTSPGQEALGLVGDVIRGRRARAQVKVLQKTTEAIQAAGLDPHVVPDKTLVPLLEYAGLEDSADDEMVGRWANLLANAATGASTKVPPSYPEILRQLEPAEAQLLENLIQERSRLLAQNQPRSRFIDLDLASIPGHEHISWRQLDNLERLGLVAYTCSLPMDVPPPPAPSQVQIAETPLGEAFFAACKPPPPSSD